MCLPFFSPCFRAYHFISPITQSSGRHYRKSRLCSLGAYAYGPRKLWALSERKGMHTDSIAMHSSKCSSSSRLGTSCSRFGRYWLERKKDATAKKGKDTERTKFGRPFWKVEHVSRRQGACHAKWQLPACHWKLPACHWDIRKPKYLAHVTFQYTNLLGFCALQ